jgi:hypothetical protein
VSANDWYGIAVGGLFGLCLCTAAIVIGASLASLRSKL